MSDKLGRPDITVAELDTTVSQTELAVLLHELQTKGGIPSSSESTLKPSVLRILVGADAAAAAAATYSAAWPRMPFHLGVLLQTSRWSS